MKCKKCKKCKKCGEIKEHKGKGMCKKCYDKEYRIENRERILKKEKERRKANPEYIKEWYKANPEYQKERRKKQGKLFMNENKSCTLFLGVHVAEQVLSKVFKNVKQMPMHNPGYDFVCNKGMKVDVKSSVLHRRKNSIKSQGDWTFTINRNTTADYFLCLAFDNREDLNPMHVWLIPGKDVNHLMRTGIAKSTLSKWSKYEKDIDKVINCCDNMKGRGELN